LSDNSLHSTVSVELVTRDHPGLPAFFAGLPKDSGWPPDTVLSLTDREPTEFERAERYVAAFVDEKIVGAISLHPAASGNYHRMHNLHFHIDILPSWQEQGVGSSLMRRLLSLAMDEGFWRVYLGTLSWNRRALALFGRFGFRVEGISRAAYRVKSRSGEDYFLDGIGMALWIGPRLHAELGDWKLLAEAELPRESDGPCYDCDGIVEIDEIVALYRSVGDHRHHFPEMLKTGWVNSDLTVTVRREGELIGLARGITDQGTTLFVCDVLVKPEFQKQGIGSELMRRLIEPYREIYQIVLLTDPETLPFYRKLGYMHWESAALRMHRPKKSE
jgi:GNAT superfamily N-acetyltransferase